MTKPSKEARRAYEQSEHGKTLRKAANTRYRKSEAGALALAEAQRRYAQSEKGKAARRAASMRYRAKMKQVVKDT